MKIVLSFLISIILFLLLPVVLMEAVFRGTIIGHALMAVVSFPFDVSFDFLGIKDLFHGNAVGIGLWVLIYFLPVLLLVHKVFKKDKSRLSAAVRCAVFALVGVLVFGCFNAFVLQAPKVENPDLRPTLLDHLKPGMTLSEARAFIPKALYTHRFLPARISGIRESLDNDGLMAMNPDRLFLAPETGEPRFELELFANGKNTDYTIKLYFTEDHRFCGVYYALSGLKEHSSDADQSDWQSILFWC